MGKNNYTKEEQEINNVLKYQDDELKALTSSISKSSIQT